MNHIVFTEKEQRLLELGGSFIAIRAGAVYLDDLLRMRNSGGIVRCHENPHDAIRVVQLDDGPVGCVAGWISEDE